MAANQSIKKPTTWAGLVWEKMKPPYRWLKSGEKDGVVLKGLKLFTTGVLGVLAFAGAVVAGVAEGAKRIVVDGIVSGAFETIFGRTWSGEEKSRLKGLGKFVLGSAAAFVIVASLGVATPFVAGAASAVGAGFSAVFGTVGGWLGISGAGPMGVAIGAKITSGIGTAATTIRTAIGTTIGVIKTGASSVTSGITSNVAAISASVGAAVGVGVIAGAAYKWTHNKSPKQNQNNAKIATPVSPFNNQLADAEKASAQQRASSGVSNTQHTLGHTQDQRTEKLTTPQALDNLSPAVQRDVAKYCTIARDPAGTTTLSATTAENLVAGFEKLIKEDRTLKDNSYILTLSDKDTALEKIATLEKVGISIDSVRFGLDEAPVSIGVFKEEAAREKAETNPATYADTRPDPKLH